jgi:hypothetical protein
METGLKHVLECKGWIKEEPEMADKNEYKVYTKCILPLDTVNRNNRKFSKEVVQKAIDQLKGRPVPCRLGMPDFEHQSYPVDEIDCRNIEGFAELSIKDHCLTANMRIRQDSEIGKLICRGLDDGTMVPAPFGTGDANVSDNVEEISDYTLTGIGIIAKNRSIW